MAFCWFTTRRREVSVGYGWLLRGVYLTLALAAAAVGFRYGRVWGREAAALAVAAACLVALIVSIARRHAGVRGQLAEHDRRSARVAAMTGIDRAEREPLARGDAEFPPLLDLVPALIGVVGLVFA